MQKIITKRFNTWMLCLTWLCLAIGLCGAAAVQANPAESGLAYLKIGLGARAAALADAYVAVADDPTALMWNPAGLGGRTGLQLAFMHNRWFSDTYGDFLGVSGQAGQFGWGLGFHLFNQSGLELREGPTEQPLAYFSAHDAWAAAGMSYRMGRGHTVGLTLKGLYEKIYLDEATGMSADLGWLGSWSDGRIRLAAALRNLGFTNNLDKESINLPATLAAGFAYRFTLGQGPDKYILATNDVYGQVNGTVYAGSGVELRYKMLALRYGYRTGEYTANHHTFGAGFIVRNWQIDYAYVPYTYDLGNTHRISMNLAL
jgi:hypothetical protein